MLVLKHLLLAGLLHINYSNASKLRLAEKESTSFARHGSLMGMISGGFGLKKFFEDSDREKTSTTPASVPESPNPKPDGTQVASQSYDGHPFPSILMVA